MLLDTAIDPFEVSQRKYRGFNPAFVRKVWQKRRALLPAYKPGTLWTPQRKFEVQQMLLKGMSARQIGQKYGLSGSAIISVIRRDPELKAIGLARSPGRSALDRGGAR